MILLYLYIFGTDPNTPVGKTISGLVSQGLNYLDTRTDFWRQQKPMYARKHEKQMMKRENRSEGSNTAKLSPNDYIIRELERIDQGNHVLKIKGIYRLFNKIDVLASLVCPQVLSRMGYQVISLKQSRYMKAVQCLLKNLKLIFCYSSSGRQVFRKSETGTAVSEHRQWFHGGHRTKQDGSHCQLTQLYRKCTLRTGQL